MLSAAMKFIFKKARELSKKQSKLGKRQSPPLRHRVDDVMDKVRWTRKSKHESTRETGEQMQKWLRAEKAAADTGKRRRRAKKDRRQRKFEDELPRN